MVLVPGFKILPIGELRTELLLPALQFSELSVLIM
nr:MAG TPA: hypothetical protein [Caudoviricetes sp.]